MESLSFNTSPEKAAIHHQPLHISPSILALSVPTAMPITAQTFPRLPAQLCPSLKPHSKVLQLQKGLAGGA